MIIESEILIILNGSILFKRKLSKFSITTFLSLVVGQFIFSIIPGSSSGEGLIFYFYILIIGTEKKARGLSSEREVGN